MIRASQLDTNHAEIVAALKAVPGCSVIDLRLVGGGCPDLLVGRGGATWFIEVKSPDASTQRPANDEVPYWRLLSDSQIEFLSKWNGCRVFVVTTPLEALLAVGEESAIRDAQRAGVL